MRKFVKRFVIFALLIGAAILAFVTFTNFSDGERSGNITKLSRRGVIFKTWEGSLDQGIYQGARPNKGNVENTIWEFSVGDKEVAQKMQEITARGNRVVLHYEEKYMKIFWVGDSKYIVTAVDEITINMGEQAPPAQEQQKQAPAAEQTPGKGNIPVENL